MVKYTPEDFLRVEKWMGHRAAHRHMADLREQMAPGGIQAPIAVMSKKLTDEEWAWHATCSHPDARIIIGEGVFEIYGMFLASIPDRNMKQPRFDIVVCSATSPPPHVRVKYSRFHPSSSGWGSAVTTEDVTFARSWWGAETVPFLDPTQEERADIKVRRLDGGTYVGVHQIDYISTREACEFLQWALDDWSGSEHPRGRFTRSLMDQSEFKWPNFVAGRPWRAQVEQVCDFWLTWHVELDKPCFAFRTAEGLFFTVMPGRTPDLAPGSENIAWH